MRTRILLAATAALLTAASAAYAANANGTVESYDPEARILVLDNGTAFSLSGRVQETDFEAGDEVQIIYSGIRNGFRVATRVTVTNDEQDTAAAN